MNSIARSALPALRHSLKPSAAITPAFRRHATTIGFSNRPVPSHMPLSQRVEKYVPVEAFPLIVACLVMTSIGLSCGAHAVWKGLEGNGEKLRLLPERFGGPHKKELWED